MLPKLTHDSLKPESQEKNIYTVGCLERFAPKAIIHPSEELQCRSWTAAEQSNLD